MAEPTATPPPAEATVDVVDPVGRKGTIPASQLADAQAQGYVPAAAVAPEKGVYEKATEKGFGPIAATGIAAISPLLSYEQGTVEGATAGLGSALQRKIAGVVGPIAAWASGGPDMTAQEAEDFYKDIAQGGAHPWVHGGGVVAGIAGGAMAGGALRGAGAVGSGLGRGLGIISEAGEGAAQGAKALTASLAARGALGRAAASATELGVRGGIEAGLYSGIHELSEEMLGDPKVSASKILAAAAEGAEGGALFGSILGGGGSLAASGVRGASGIARNALTKHAEEFENLANDQYWRTTGAREKFTREAEKRFPGGARGVGGVIGKYGATDLDKIQESLQAVGEKIGEVRGGSNAMVKWGDLDDAIERVAAPLRESPLLKPKLDRIQEIREAFASSLIPETTVAPGTAIAAPADALKAMREVQIPIKDVIKQRQILDDILFEEASGSPILRAARERARSNIEEAVMTAFDNAAKASGNPGAAAELRTLKRDYQALSIARDASEASGIGGKSNRMLGMTDYLAAGAGVATLGPAGALAALGNKYLREHGNELAAKGLDVLAKAGGRARQVVKLADLAEVGSALEKEAAAADRVAGAATQEATAAPAAVAEAPAATTKLAYAPTMGPKTYEELGVTAGPRASRQSAEDITEMGKNVFGDKVPTAADWQNMYRVPEGYSVKFTDMGPSGKGAKVHNKDLIVSANILDAEGKPVGDLVRQFKRDADGKLVVEHSSLMLDPSVQGKGIGSALSKSSLEAYHDMGVDRIELYAGMSAGPYAWARQGYKFNPDEIESQKWSADQFGQSEKLAPEQVAELKAAIDKSPRAVSDVMAGERKLGKDFLLASGGWGGHMNVAEAHAEMLNKVAELAQAQRAAKVVDAKIESTAKAIVDGVTSETSMPAAKAYRKPGRAGPTEEASTKSLTQRYDTAQKELAAAVENQKAIIERASSMFRHMPQVAQASAVAAMRSLAYLQSKSPVPLTNPSLSSPAPRRVSDVQMQRFVDDTQVVKTHGMSALDAMRRGRMSIQQSRALREVNPEAFQQLQYDCQKLVTARIAAGTPIDFAARQRMHLLLGIQTDPSQSPGMLRSLQENLQMADAPPEQMQGRQAKAPSARGGNASMPSEQTKFDRLE